MSPTLLDHGLVVLCAVGYPLLGHLARPAPQRDDEPASPVHDYRTTMIVQWTLAGIVIAAWLLASRPLAALGLGASSGIGGWGAWAQLAIGAAIAIGAVAQAALVTRRPTLQAQVRKALGGFQPHAPRTARDMRWFVAVSVTAGVCEEVLWRGYLIWYLSGWMDAWLAAAISTLAFGAAHAYLGVRGAAKAAAAGAVAAALYLVGGSLWIPIILHALVDATSGWMAYVALRDHREAAGDAVEPG